tara:strand:+ start:1774 stop:2343 length:570 start_codon:yes stop_codon:yes gene_type:complete
MEVLMSDKQVKRTGDDILYDLEQKLATLDSLPHEDEEALAAWQEEFDELLSNADDKMLAYRHAIEFASSRKEFFKKQRERYAVRFRAQGRVIDRVKELAHSFLRRHNELTGEKRLSLKDGTWATLSKSPKDWLFYNSATGEAELSVSDVPTEYLKMEISRSALKSAARSATEIPGIGYTLIEKTHVRWS